MWQLRRIRNGLILVGLLAGTGTVLYYTLLNEEARRELNKAVKAVGSSYKKLYGVLEDSTGIIMEEDKDTLPNRIATLRQWEALGF